MKEVGANDILDANLPIPLFKDFRLIMSVLKGGEWMMAALGFFVLVMLMVILEE